MELKSNVPCQVLFMLSVQFHPETADGMLLLNIGRARKSSKHEIEGFSSG